MKKRLSFTILLTILIGLLPSMMAYAQTYTVSPSGYTSVPTSNVTQGSRTFHGDLLQAKATVSGQTATFTLKKKDGSKFQNSGNIVVKNDSYDGTTVKSNIRYDGGIYNPTVDVDLDFTSGSKTYVIIIKSGDIFYYTNPITIKASSSSSSTVNLALASTPSFGTTILTKGKSYTFTVKVKNNGSSSWKGAFYLKSGSTNWISKSATIKAGETATLTDTYTPTTTGTHTLKFYYQTGGTGDGVLVPAGSYSNPVYVTVAEDQTTLSVPDKSTFSATNVTTTGFTANWSAVSGATKYNINVKKASDSEYNSSTTVFSRTGVTSTSCNVTGLQPGTSYQFQIQAANSTQTSKWSASIPTAVTTKSEAVNLVLASTPSFGTTILTKGKSYTFTVKVKNNGSSSWKGAFYLKSGSTNWISKSVTIKAGETATLTDTYTPTTTGTHTLKFYYQTGGTGDGVLLSKGSYQNPITVSVTSESTQTETANLTLASVLSFSTSNQSVKSLIKGQTYTFSVRVKNTGSTAWKGAFYLKNGSEVLLSWGGQSIASGSTITLTDTYKSRTTGNMTLDLFYQTGGKGSGILVNSGNYQNPLTISVAPSLATPDKSTFKATNVGETEFTANWGSVQGADCYDILVKKASDEDYSNYVFKRATSRTYIKVTDLTPGTSYQFQIRARNSDDGNSSNWSSSIPTAVKTLNAQGTTAANLSILSVQGVDGSTSLTVGKTAHYSALVVNDGASRWNGSLYLKDGKNNIKGWYSISLPSGVAQRFECDYTPDAKGSKSLVLYYQTGGIGDGVPVSAGKAKNPIVVQVNEAKSSSYDLKLKNAITCPTTIDWGNSTTIIAKVLNGSNSDWTGTLYLTDNNNAINTPQQVTIKSGSTYTITAEAWTPKSADTHTISVFYKTKGESDKTQVGTNGYKNPVSITVSNFQVATTATEANLTLITKDCAPKEVNVGDQVFYYYRIKDKNGNPLKGMKAQFECTVSGRKSVVETLPSDENGYATLYLSTEGSDAFAARGETGKFVCTGFVDEKNQPVQLRNGSSADGEFYLTIHKGNSLSSSIGFENVESLSLTLNRGVGAGLEAGIVEASATLSFPLTSTIKWKDGKMFSEIESEIQGELDGGVKLGSYLQAGANLTGSIKESTTYNWDYPGKTTLAICMAMLENQYSFTSSNMLRSVMALENWFGVEEGFFDPVISKPSTTSASWGYSFSGKVKASLLKQWPTYQAINPGSSTPILAAQNFVGGKITGALDASLKIVPDIVEEDFTTSKKTYGLSREMSAKLSGNIQEAYGELAPANQSMMKYLPKNNLKKFNDKYYTIFNDFSWDFGAYFAMKVKEKEMYRTNERKTLDVISNSLSTEYGVKLSTDQLVDYLCPEWVDANTEKAGGKGTLNISGGYGLTWDWKMSSKGTWANHLLNLSKKHGEIVGNIFPVLYNDDNIIHAPSTYFNILTDNTDLYDALDYAASQANASYLINESFKIEQQEKEKLYLKCSIPIAKWWLIDIAVDLGGSIEASYYPSVTYYGVADRRFFPVVLRKSDKFANSVKGFTSWFSENIEKAFSDQDKEQISNEAQNLSDWQEEELGSAWCEITNNGKGHSISGAGGGGVSSWIKRRAPKLDGIQQDDICTFSFGLNEDGQNFNDGIKLYSSHYYPTGKLLGITDQNDTLFVVSEVFDVTAVQGNDSLKHTQQGYMRMKTYVGADDLTPFGFAEDMPLDVYYSEAGSDIWSYVGPAGSTLMVDKLGSYMMATSIKNDVIAPEITMDFDETTRLLLLNVSDNIALRTKSLKVYVNGESKEVGMINESNFEVQLNPEDMDYRLDVYVSAYDLAGNRGDVTQMFNLDKPEKVSMQNQPDTDISQLENTLYIEPVSATAGSEVILSVKMKNKIEAEGFQFDLELPEGVSVAKDADGYAEAYLSTERTTARKTNTFDTAFLGNGLLRVIAGSTNGSTISGNDGEVATIKLKIDNSVAAGSYPVALRNIAISDVNAVSHDVAYVKSTMTIGGGLMGDANNDGVVNVFDVTAMVNYILGSSTGTFMFEAADVNADGIVNVFDVTKVVNIILGVDAGAKRRVAMREAGKGVMSAVIDGNEMYLVVDDAPQYVAMQFDVVMPEGTSVGDVELNNTAGHMLSYRQIDENHYRVIAYSLQNAGFKPTEKALVCMKQATGANIENAMLVTTDGRCINMNVKDEATGIDPVDVRNERKAIYNLSGQYMGTDVNSLPKGIYIRNKQKVYIK